MTVDYYNEFKSLTNLHNAKHNSNNQVGGDPHEEKHVFDNIHSITSYKSTKDQQESLLDLARKAIETSRIQTSSEKESYYVDQARDLLYKINNLKHVESKHHESHQMLKDTFNNKVKEEKEKQVRIKQENHQRELEVQAKQEKQEKLRKKQDKIIKTASKVQVVNRPSVVASHVSPSNQKHSLIDRIQNLNVMHSI